MRTDSWGLSLILLAANLMLCKAPNLLRTTPKINRTAINFSDPESLLTQGKRLKISTVDIYALELIPGISDTLAQRIIARRDGIMSVAHYLRPSERHRAFEVVDGVALKTAQRLAMVLDPSS